jgi:hypothetical protein
MRAIQFHVPEPVLKCSPLFKIGEAGVESLT